LYDHAVLDEGADDAVGRRRGELEAGGQLRKAHPARALEGAEHADRAVDRLDHVRPSAVDSFTKTLA
jgi:hypothetical protein